MYKLKNNILILSITFTSILISLLLIISIEEKYNEWTDSFLNTDTSDIEIMTTNYYNIKHLLPNKYYLYNYPDYLKVIKNIVDEDNLSQLLKYNGYIVSPKYEYQVLVNGIEPDKYKMLFKNITNIIEGKYLTTENKYSSIIGKTIAEKLELKVGDRFIIRLLDVNNLYKAEEFVVSGIIDSRNEKVNKENIYINIGILNNIIADKYAYSSIHVRTKNNNVYNTLRKLFPDNIGLYTKYDINTLLISNDSKLINIKRYVYLFFSIAVFSIYFYINSKAFSIYKIDNFNSGIIKNILFSFVGFIAASIIIIVFFGNKYSTYSILLFVINTLLLLVSSYLPYIYTKKRVVKV